MKRDEAVNIIANLLLELAPQTYESQSSYSRRGDASLILKKLEDAGMRAPAYAAHPETGKPMPFSKGITINLHNWEVDE